MKERAVEGGNKVELRERKERKMSTEAIDDDGSRDARNVVGICSAFFAIPRPSFLLSIAIEVTHFQL